MQHHNQLLIQEHKGCHKLSQFYIYMGTISLKISKFCPCIDRLWLHNQRSIWMIILSIMLFTFHIQCQHHCLLLLRRRCISWTILKVDQGMHAWVIQRAFSCRPPSINHIHVISCCVALANLHTLTKTILKIKHPVMSGYWKCILLKSWTEHIGPTKRCLTHECEDVHNKIWTCDPIPFKRV